MIKIKVNTDESVDDIEVNILAHSLNGKVISLVDKIKSLDSVDSVQAYKDKLVSIISINNIVRIYSEDRSIFLETSKDKYTVKENLKTLDSILDDSFIRISNSEIINVNKIKNLDLSMTGTIKVNFSNGNYTYVSRRYVSKIKEKLNL